MAAQRPLDVLNRALGSSVLVSLKGGKEFRGKLSGFDVHVNLVLEEAEEIQGGQTARRYGTMIIRGDNVVFISILAAKLPAERQARARTVGLLSRVRLGETAVDSNTADAPKGHGDGSTVAVDGGAEAAAGVERAAG